MQRLAVNEDTSTRILDLAEQLVQTRGFNAFSYADIAAALHVTTATLHYHFRTKAALGERLIERYQTAFLAALERVDASARDSRAKLKAYVGIYSGVLDDDRMCLCGMLAADYATLSPAMQSAVRRFFEANESWLAELLRHGREKGELGFRGSPIETARVIVGALEGAMLLARSHGEAARFRSAAACLLADLCLKKRAAAAPGRKARVV